MTENDTLALIAALVFIYKMSALGYRHQQAKRRDAAKGATP